MTQISSFFHPILQTSYNSVSNATVIPKVTQKLVSGNAGTDAISQIFERQAPLLTQLNDPAAVNAHKKWVPKVFRYPHSEELCFHLKKAVEFTSQKQGSQEVEYHFLKAIGQLPKSIESWRDLQFCNRVDTLLRELSGMYGASFYLAAALTHAEKRKDSKIAIEHVKKAICYLQKDKKKLEKQKQFFDYLDAIVAPFSQVSQVKMHLELLGFIFEKKVGNYLAIPLAEHLIDKVPLKERSYVCIQIANCATHMWHYVYLAEACFQRGIKADPFNPDIRRAYALMRKEFGIH